MRRLSSPVRIMAVKSSLHSFSLCPIRVNSSSSSFGIGGFYFSSAFYFSGDTFFSGVFSFSTEGVRDLFDVSYPGVDCGSYCCCYSAAIFCLCFATLIYVFSDLLESSDYLRLSLTLLTVSSSRFSLDSASDNLSSLRRASPFYTKSLSLSDLTSESDSLLAAYLALSV